MRTQLTKLSDRLRESATARQTISLDEYGAGKALQIMASKDEKLLLAADLLDECERTLAALINCPVVSEMDRDAAWGCLESVEAEHNAQNTLAKLRAAKEIEK